MSAWSTGRQAGWAEAHAAYQADREALSTMLREMARRATELRREARTEYMGRQVAEQNLRYAPISGIEQYRREISAAWFARQDTPPVPWPILEPGVTSDAD